jgi:CheY-like chemotaxis protein
LAVSWLSPAPGVARLSELDPVTSNSQPRLFIERADRLSRLYAAFLGLPAEPVCFASRADALSSLLYIWLERKPRLRDISARKRGVQILQDLIVIMVVEDDQVIQALVEESLTEAGFEPAIAASGEEAVTLLRGARNHYRALVTDISLLGTMDGWKVAKQAREIDPTLPIVYITGAAADEWTSQGVPNSVLLTKPFAPAQLVTAVAQLLNKAPPPA